MARVVSVYNFKGGVGKTVSIINLAKRLYREHKVLIIDFDPQVNLTSVLGNDQCEGETNIFEAIRNSIHHNFPIATPTKINRNLDLLFGSEKIISLETNSQFIEFGDLLIKSLIESLDADYDYILIDCPSYFGKSVENILANSDNVMIPMNPDIFSIKGAVKVINRLKSLTRYRNLKLLGLYLNKFNQKLVYHQKIHKVCRKLFHRKLMDSSLRYTIRVSESIDNIAGSEMSMFTIDFDRLFSEVMERLNSLPPVKQPDLSRVLS